MNRTQWYGIRMPVAVAAGGLSRCSDFALDAIFQIWRPMKLSIVATENSSLATETNWC